MSQSYLNNVHTARYQTDASEMVMDGLLDEPTQIFTAGNVVLIETSGAAGRPICQRERQKKWRKCERGMREGSNAREEI